MKRHSRKSPANRMTCPNPQCGAVQQARTRHGKHRGRGIDACTNCRREYFYHVADGGAETHELYPGEAERLDIDAPLPELWKRLGVMAVA